MLYQIYNKIVCACVCLYVCLLASLYLRRRIRGTFEWFVHYNKFEIPWEWRYHTVQKLRVTDSVHGCGGVKLYSLYEFV